MLSFDATFLWVLISFVVFMLLMKGLYFDPIQQIKEKREHQKEQDAARRKECMAASVELETSYENGLKEARKKAHQLIQQQRQDALKRAAEEVAQSKASAMSKLQGELDKLAHERDALYEQLLSEKQALADLIIQKVTTVKIPTAL